MTQNRRIILNILATYGRSLFSLACGLFTSRWVLQSLGVVDYGLYGLVGGLTVFISFFNGLMAGATGRFYAYSIGAARRAENHEVGLEGCRSWFNTALMIHTILPIFLLSLGYPIGVQFVRNGLTIPADRVEDCVWVFRFVCASCFVSMVNVPFQGMYTAKQYIAELTIYGLATTVINLVFVSYMITHPSSWLVPYALVVCLALIIPQLLICIRAWCIFPECKIRFKYWWDWGKVRQMWSFAGWNAFAGIGNMCRHQGVAILINKNFGPQINASMAVANQVSSQAQSLTTAMQGAFAPAITTACGAGEWDQMRAFAFRACKFGTLLSLIFVIPLAVELPSVLTLWLKTPPPFSIRLCFCMLCVLVIDKSSIGCMSAVNANGRVALYQGFLGTALILTLPIAWALIHMQCGAVSVGYAFVLVTVVCTCGRVYFAQRLVGMRMKYWACKIAIPLMLLILASSAVGYLPHLFMGRGFLRIVLTTIIVEMSLLPLAWALLFDCDERIYVLEHIVFVLKKHGFIKQ